MRRLATALLPPLALAACTSGDPSSEPAVPTSESAHMPTDADHAAILATVQSLFDALASGDGQILRDIMHPNVVMHSWSAQPTAPGPARPRPWISWWRAWKAAKPS